MKRVILESPYGNDDPAIVAENVRYARQCVRDCLARGESPIASHLLYTQDGILNDNNPEERKWGIEAGLAWGAAAELTVVYVDRGISRGMAEFGIPRAVKEHRNIEFRSLNPLLNQLLSTLHSWEVRELFNLHKPPVTTGVCTCGADYCVWWGRKMEAGERCPKHPNFEAPKVDAA